MHTGKPQPGWVEALPRFEPGESVATRDAGAKVMEAFKHFTPTMVGGAADLVESTKTEFKGGGLFAATHAGRNIPFGIREHAMGSIVNGISLHDGMVKPYGSTFLIFSDYMRHAVRLSALSRCRSLWVWTHDSVGLGEDGPTHQPVEHYAALRAIPFLWFVRPADATETVGAWKVALEREDGPVASCADAAEGADARARRRSRASRAAHTSSTTRDDAPELILLATGSEVALALEAAQKIDVPTRVVSMPCWELFEAQPSDYRDEVLPPDVKARLSIEAGVALGWKRVGRRRGRLAVDRALRRLGAWPDRARAVRLHGRQRRRAGAQRCANASLVNVAVAFDHRGVHLRDAILETLQRTGTRSSTSAPTPTRSGSTIRTRRRRSAPRSSTAGPSAACSSAARASALRWPRARSPGSGQRSATTCYSAHQGVEHDDMNVLCLGSEVVGPSLAADLVRTFLGGAASRRRPVSSSG